MIGIIPLYCLSVEHLKLQEKYGYKKGKRIAEIYGLVSGWCFFIFWMGIWISPQPRFNIPFLQKTSFLIEPANFSISIIHLVVSLPFIIVGGWFGIKGVKETTIKVAEIHRTEKIVSTDVYSFVRHPQYFGGLLAHFGISILFSALYSLFSTPLIVLAIYHISKKEEDELIKEFGKNYEEYKKKVPMLFPRL
jgi:protein-S-isoprenylcysteine O-methyltransferase Ste14